MRDGPNGYVPSPGISEAREAVAQEWTRHGFPAHPDRVLVTAGTSEGIELALTALVNPGDAVLVPSPTYPLYTAVLAKIGAEASVLPHRSRQRLAAGPRAPRVARSRRARGRWSSSIRTTRRAPSIRSPCVVRSSTSPSATAW